MFIWFFAKLACARSYAMRYVRVTRLSVAVTTASFRAGPSPVFFIDCVALRPVKQVCCMLREPRFGLGVDLYFVFVLGLARSSRRANGRGRSGGSGRVCLFSERFWLCSYDFERFPMIFARFRPVRKDGRTGEPSLKHIFNLVLCPPPPGGPGGGSMRSGVLGRFRPDPGF